MHIWNTGKLFKTGSAPSVLPHFHTYFQTLCSILSVLLKHYLIYCLPLLDNPSPSLLLEDVSIMHFCLLLVRYFQFTVTSLILALFYHCEVHVGVVCCMYGGNKSTSIFSVTLFEWAHDTVHSYEIQWYDIMFECLWYIMIKRGQLLYPSTLI